MAKQISITRDATAQLHAAKELFSVLNRLQISHVVIGSFALHLFGSPRHNNDISLMADTTSNKIEDFLHVPNLVKGLAEGELVLVNKGNVLIEILSTSTRITVEDQPCHDCLSWRGRRELW